MTQRHKKKQESKAARACAIPLTLDPCPLPLSSLLLCFLVSLFFANQTNAGTVTLVTYCPEPLANYDRVRLIPQDPRSGSCTIGALYNRKGNGVDQKNSIYYCKDAAGAGEWGILGEDIWMRTADDIYLKDLTDPADKLVGIGLGTYNPSTNTPEFKLTLKNNAGIIAKGTYDPLNPTLTDLGISGRAIAFFWYPKKAALRAGEQDQSRPWDTWDDPDIGSHSVAFGKNTHAAGDLSTVGGGEGNLITPGISHSFIGGGQNNNGSTSYSAIVGGLENSILAGPGTHSFIGGGYQNSIGSGSFSTIIGGSGNRDGPGATNITIGGGKGNSISFPGPGAGSISATIIGGESNKIANSAPSDYATIGGGQGNIAEGQGAAVHGGLTNAALAKYTVVAGGANNLARFEYSAIAGGSDNWADAGQYAAIGGGNGNKIYADYSVILGGEGNKSRSSYGFIGGGKGNETGLLPPPLITHAAVAGGNGNTASGDYSFVGGGENNRADGAYSVVPGGFSNAAGGDYSWAGGENMIVGDTADRTFVWGFSNSPLFISAPDAFIIYSDYDPDGPGGSPVSPIKVGINTKAPDELLHVTGSVRIDGQVKITNPPGVAGTGSLKIHDTSGLIGYVGFDLAETFFAGEALEPGDVVISDPANPSRIRKSFSPYQKNVVGIVSSAPAVTFQYNQIKAGPAAGEASSFSEDEEAPVALLGQVICKVSLENGPIEAGDLLTPSSLPGHAMKASDAGNGFYSVVAKALEPFSGGAGGDTGEILVLMVGR